MMSSEPFMQRILAKRFESVPEISFMVVTDNSLFLIELILFACISN